MMITVVNDQLNSRMNFFYSVSLVRNLFRLFKGYSSIESNGAEQILKNPSKEKTFLNCKKLDFEVPSYLSWPF